MKTTNFRIARYIGRFSSYVVLIVVFFISILPIFWIFSSGFAPRGDLMMDPFAIPRRLTLENLIAAWTTGRMSVYMTNSILVAIPRVLGVLTLSSLAGYAFGKLQFKGREIIFKFMLFGLMVPIQAMIIPIFFNLSRMGLIDSREGIIIPYFGLSMPFAIFMMRAFFKDLPDDLMGSAKIDGCNEFTTFLYIMLPLIKPAVTALLVFEFMWSWNDLFLPLMVTFGDRHRTLPLGLMFFTTEFTRDNTLIAAATVITIMPIITLYIIFQRKFIEGITSGAVKG